MKTGCIILAGGKSSRMGTDKALLNYNGQKFIEIIADELSFFEEKIIARGNNSILGRLEKDSWKIVADEYPEHGPIGGLHAALKNCESDAMFVVTCDMPLMTGNLARKIYGEMCGCVETAKHDELGGTLDAVIAVSNDGKYHPLCGVYRKELYQLMEEYILQDNNRVMAVLKNCRVKYVNLNEEESKQLANVNTRDEYEKLGKI